MIPLENQMKNRKFVTINTVQKVSVLTSKNQESETQVKNEDLRSCLIIEDELDSRDFIKEFDNLPLISKIAKEEFFTEITKVFLHHMENYNVSINQILTFLDKCVGDQNTL